LTPITRTILGEQKAEGASLTPVGGAVLKPTVDIPEQSTPLTPIKSAVMKPVGGAVLKPTVDIPEQSASLTPIRSAVMKPVSDEPQGEKPARGQPPSSEKSTPPGSGRGAPPSSGKGKPPSSDKEGDTAKLTPVTMLTPLKLPGDDEGEDDGDEKE